MTIADMEPVVTATLPGFSDDLLDDPDMMTYRRANGTSVRFVRFDAAKGLPLGRFSGRHGTVPMIGVTIVPRTQPAQCPVPLRMGWTFVQSSVADLVQAWVRDRGEEAWREETELDALALVQIVTSVHAATMPEAATRTAQARKLRQRTRTKTAVAGRRRIYGYSRR